MTDRLREAAQAALQLCDWINESPHERGSINGIAAQVGHALRAALAEPEVEQKPVAYLYTYHGKVAWGDRLEFPGTRWQGPGYNHMPNNWRETPLYAAPPRREWQGLTNEERKQFVQWMHPDLLARIEAALKEKNHD